MKRGGGSRIGYQCRCYSKTLHSGLNEKIQCVLYNMIVVSRSACQYRRLFPALHVGDMWLGKYVLVHVYSHGSEKHVVYIAEKLAIR